MFCDFYMTTTKRFDLANKIADIHSSTGLFQAIRLLQKQLHLLRFLFYLLDNHRVNEL